ncbi:MAG: hypothetical protein ACOCWQ_06015 [Nanoarchaeota archaeon]
MRQLRRRGQVALEFLITYGWAFAVILGALASLAYVGVFDFSSFITERCEFSTGIYCVDGIAKSTGVSVAVQNGMPIDLENVVVVINECGTATGSGNILSGETQTYDANCALSSGTAFKSPIVVNYTNPDSGFNHTKIGTIVYKVQI